MPRHIAIVTSTRADWGLLAPVAKALRLRPDCTVTVVATNMHLDPARGNTLRHIQADGFDPLIAPVDPTASAPQIMAQTLSACADCLAQLKPDLLLLLGDRFEMLAVASAATLLRLPIAHMHGGEVTVGAFDDGFRHAITHLSALHLTSTEAYARRVIQLGEEPERVHAVGAVGARLQATMSCQELEADLAWHFGDQALLVTMHPETLADHTPIDELLAALDQFPQSQLLITYPNNDPGADQIIAALKAYEARQPQGRVKLIPSLGAARYAAALQCVKAVVGNSSSGIIEVPSAGIATVNIGRRQEGRIAAESVIHCAGTTDSIAAAIAAALALDCSAIANPYYQPDTVDKIARILAETPLELLRRPKRFHDI